MFRLYALLITLAIAPCAFGQTSAAPAPSAGRSISPNARLAAAHTVYLKNAGGSELPFSVISDGLQSWGRFQIVNAAENADIVIEVTAPAAGNGVSVTSTTSNDPLRGTPTQSVTHTKELQVSRITMIVYDSKSKMALWSSSEQPKGGLREKARKDNVIASAQHLVSKFRSQLEPEAAQ